MRSHFIGDRRCGQTSLDTAGHAVLDHSPIKTSIDTLNTISQPSCFKDPLNPIL